MEEGYTSNIEVVDAELSSRLDETLENNQTSILLVDPWAARTHPYRDALAEYDSQNRPATGVLVPCHDQDEESGSPVIWEDLSRVLWRNWRRQNDPSDQLFRVRVPADEFDGQLAVTLAVAQNRLMEMESTTPYRLPEGPTPPPMAGLTIPGPAPAAVTAPHPPPTDPVLPAQETHRDLRGPGHPDEQPGGPLTTKDTGTTTNSPTAPGKIVTFYSYKGGTGRTMALANVGWILAASGHRVLLVDWDLEAPGLHRYLHPLLIDPELRASNGLINMMQAYVRTVLSRRPPTVRAAADGGLGTHDPPRPSSRPTTGCGLPRTRRRTPSDCCWNSPPGAGCILPRDASRRPTPPPSPPSTGAASTSGTAARASSRCCGRS